MGPVKLLSQGVASKQAKDSSVKKLLLIGVLPEYPENYSNVKLMLEKLNITDSEFMFSADLKMCKLII